MDRERHHRVTEIFLQACDLPSGERSRYLERACGGNRELLEEVESLLIHDRTLPTEMDVDAVHSRIRAYADSCRDSRETAPMPTRIGSYHILGVLGEGSQGVVYKAMQQSPNRKVALKVFKGGPLSARHEKRSFERESQALASMSHPAIATIYDAGTTEEGHPYFSMEWVDGATVDRYARDHRLGLRRRLELLCRVCDAVQHAHDRSIVHRDLKPTNILVDRNGDPRILDFGLTRRLDVASSTDSTFAGAGRIVGSLNYMSPEQASGETADVGPATDVYSLGVILYELLTGRRPYEIPDSLPDALATIGKTPPTPPGSLNPRLRGCLDLVLLRALEKEPRRRYGSVVELSHDLRRYLGGQRIRGRAWRYLPSRLGPLRRHPREALALGLVLVAVTLGVGARAWWASSQRTEARLMACGIQHRLDCAPAERVLSEARRLHDRFPEVTETLLALARTLVLAGRETDDAVLETEAIRLLKMTLEEDESRWPVRHLLGEIYENLHNPEGVREKGRAEREAGRDARSWYLRSMATLDVAEAAEHARSSVDLDPGSRPARARLAYLCERMGDLRCALDLAADLAREGDARWEQFAARTLTRHGRHREAIERCESLVTDNPTAILRLQAANHLCLGALDEALDRYSVAIAANRKPYYRWDQYGRATVFWMMGRLEDASRDYVEFRRVEGCVTHADARLYLLRREMAQRLDEAGSSEESGRIREQAERDLLAAIRATEPGSWLQRVLRCLSGEISPDDLVASAERARPGRVCEAAYYAAEACRLRGESSCATAWWRRCVETGLVFDPNEHVPYPMAEYHLARWRLGQAAATGV